MKLDLFGAVLGRQLWWQQRAQFQTVSQSTQDLIALSTTNLDQRVPCPSSHMLAAVADKGGDHVPPSGGLSTEVLVHLTSVMSSWTCHSSFLVTENGHIWQLYQYCENGLQMENKLQEILHHLGIQKYAKLCQKYTKIRMAAGLHPDPLGEL